MIRPLRSMRVSVDVLDKKYDMTVDLRERRRKMNSSTELLIKKPGLTNRTALKVKTKLKVDQMNFN